MNKQLLRFIFFLLMYLTLPLAATAQVVDIPDANLRAAIESALGKASGAPITVAEMATLAEFEAENAAINDLTGLEFAANLERLELGHKRVGNTDVNSNSISDISPLAGLTNLERLDLEKNSISDISVLAGLTNLTWLNLAYNPISDISPLAGLTNLTWLALNKNPTISDISSLAGLTNLTRLTLHNNSISDISPLAGLTNLTELTLSNNSISDISPLAGLTNLTWLNLTYNPISDISPLTGLTRLTSLSLENHPLSDLSPLAGLTNLTELNLERSSLSDLSFLAGLTNLRQLDLHKNLISDISPLTGLTNLTWLNLHRNLISDLSPLVANTGLGDGDWIRVFENPLSDTSINTHISTLRGRGITVQNTKLFFPTINPVSVGDTFTLSLVVDDVVDLAGWQLDITFNPAVLKAVSVSEGDFLATGGGSTFFASGNTNNTTGEITEITAAFIGTGGISGTGALLEITFEAAAYGEGRLRLENVRLGDPNGDSIPHEIVINPFNFKPRHDVNGDGNVNILDIVLIVQNFGQANPRADVNGDGNVNIFDLIIVAQHLGESTTGLAPGGLAWHGLGLNVEMIQNWIDMAHAADDGSLAFQLGIANLKRLLAAIRPDTTALLTNYPNPFNPETWIPYHLAHDADEHLRFMT